MSLFRSAASPSQLGGLSDEEHGKLDAFQSELRRCGAVSKAPVKKLMKALDQSLATLHKGSNEGSAAGEGADSGEGDCEGAAGQGEDDSAEGDDSEGEGAGGSPAE